MERGAINILVRCVSKGDPLTTPAQRNYNPGSYHSSQLILLYSLCVLCGSAVQFAFKNGKFAFGRTEAECLRSALAVRTGRASGTPREYQLKRVCFEASKACRTSAGSAVSGQKEMAAGGRARALGRSKRCAAGAVDSRSRWTRRQAADVSSR